MKPGDAAASLDAEQAAFVSGAVSINVSSRDANFVPSVARAFGCRVAMDGGRVTVFLPSARAEGVLLRPATRRPGIGGVQPPEHPPHPAGQGRRRRGSAPARGERDLMLDYARCFGEEIRALDFDEAFVRAMASGAGEDAVAVCFTPPAVYDQTPGPGAGRRVAPGP
ncbi:MAG: hypothetical protein M5U09_15565 [Gammaproteobacteria bacterium]|nr:hypothetical protein [Gammaproteobacteria bacterium]